MEKTLGKSDVLTVTYLGAAGRKLMQGRETFTMHRILSSTVSLTCLSNGADSSYQALQAQFRHRLAHGLQTLLSYTWAHSIDDVSSDAYYLHVPPGNSTSERGSSDYDIRRRLRRSFL